MQRRALIDQHTVDDRLTWQASGGFSLEAAVDTRGSDAAIRA
jgi:hypothetical protein